jgi:aldehyde:ferredoxin oxidoreductase
MESLIVRAVTGRDLDEESLNRIGERIFNLQRSILLKQGRGGREGDDLLEYVFEEPLDFLFFDPECIAPGKNGQKISKKGAMVDREGFERLKDEYYTLRGWDPETGFPIRQTLQGLDLEDIAGDLEKRGLVR